MIWPIIEVSIKSQNPPFNTFGVHMLLSLSKSVPNLHFLLVQLKLNTF